MIRDLGSYFTAAASVILTNDGTGPCSASCGPPHERDRPPLDRGGRHDAAWVRVDFKSNLEKQIALAVTQAL